MLPIGNPLLNKAVDSMTHPPEKSIEGDLEWAQSAPLSLVDIELPNDEKETFLSILGESKLTPNVSVLDLLFYDLHEELGKIEKLVEKGVFDRVIADLEMCYAGIVVGQDQDTTRFQGFLNAMIADLIRSNFAMNAKLGSESQKVKAPGDTKLLTRCLFGRVNLLKKLAALPKSREIFSMPLKHLAANYNLAVTSAEKLKSVFTNNSQFLGTVYNALLRVQPQLREFAEVYAGVMNTICQAGDPASSLYRTGVVNVLIFSSLLVDDRIGTPYLNRLLRESTAHYADIAIKYSELCKKYTTQAADLSIQQGHVPSFLERTFDSKDKLAEFKAEHLVESTFVLTAEESALIDEIFCYPLDSQLTLFDLLGFAFFERMERLKDYSRELAPTINEFQGLLSSSFLRLWVGLHREFGEHVNAMGAINDYSKKFALFPQNAFTWFDNILNAIRQIWESKPVRQQRLILTQFTKTVVPLRNLLVRLFASKGYYQLLTKSASMYLGHERLDQSDSKPDMIYKYWNHLKRGYQKGCEEGFIGVNYDFKRILDDDQFFTKKLSEGERLLFGTKVSTAMLQFDQNSELILKNLNEAIAGTLTHANWCRMMGMQKIHEKNHQEFKEQLFSSFFLMGLLAGQITDLLRLVECRIYPSKSLKTASCQYRLRYNMQLCQKIEKKGDSTLLPVDISQKATDLWEALQRSFNLMRPIFHFNVTDHNNLNNVFNYAKWMGQLARYSVVIESTFSQTLASLVDLKKEILQFYQTKWSSLSIDELEKINSLEIKEALFTAGLQLLRPLMVLSDMLALLQKRRYSEEAAIIPRELADIMKLDELKKLHTKLIRKKIRDAKPIEPTLTPVPQEDVPLSQPKIDAAVPKSRLVKKKPEKSVAQVKRFEPQPPLPVAAKEEVRENEHVDDLKELEQLTKSREILSKLKGMGFFEVRQKGSHHILEGPEGGQVVVPNNPQLPRGTRHSITEQASAALNKK